jgi:MFS family permease
VLPSGVHYGWWIAVGIAVVMFATVGVGFYGLAVFLRPLQEENGWSNAAVSGATGLYFSATGLTGFAVGPLGDRNGPIRYMTVGVALVGVSVLMLTQVDQLWQLYAVYLIQAVAFGLAGSVAVSSIMARWFVTKRAKALSISSTGVSLGGVVLSPLGTWLVGRGGVALAALVMGLLVLAVGLAQPAGAGGGVGFQFGAARDGLAYGASEPVEPVHRLGDAEGITRSRCGVWRGHVQGIQWC